MPIALQNRAIFPGRRGRKGAETEGGRGVASKGHIKEKRMRENGSVNFAHSHSPGETDFFIPQGQAETRLHRCYVSEQAAAIWMKNRPQKIRQKDHILQALLQKLVGDFF